MRSIRARLDTLEKIIDVEEGSPIFIISEDGIHCSIEHVPDLQPGYSDNELAAYKAKYYHGKKIVVLNMVGILE